MKSTVYYLIGIPGSGKSTYSEKIKKEKGIDIILSSDGLRKELTGNEADITTIPVGGIFKILKERAKSLIKEGKDFIFDAVNIDPAFRRADISFLKNEGAKLVGVLMITPKEVALDRNAKRNRVVPEEYINHISKVLSENPLEFDQDLLDELIMVDENGREEFIYNRDNGEGRLSTVSAEAKFLRR